MKIYLNAPFSRWVESPVVPSKEDVFPYGEKLYEVIEVRWEILSHQLGMETPSLEAEVFFKETIIDITKCL